jgi:hypothetical protein
MHAYTYQATAIKLEGSGAQEKNTPGLAIEVLQKLLTDYESKMDEGMTSPLALQSHMCVMDRYVYIHVKKRMHSIRPQKRSPQTEKTKSD